MKHFIVGTLAGLVFLGLQASVVLAYHCPVLVKECNALVAKLENNPKADKEEVAEAKKECAEAQQLHDAGKHADAVIKAGEAIAAAGEAVK